MKNRFIPIYIYSLFVIVLFLVGCKRIVEVEVIKEIEVEKPVEVEVIKEVEKEVFVEKPVEVEKKIYVDKEIIVEKPVEVIKEIEVEKTIEVIKEIEKEVVVEKEVQVQITEAELLGIELSTSEELSNTNKTISVKITSPAEIKKVVWKEDGSEIPSKLLNDSTALSAEKVANNEWEFKVNNNGEYRVAVEDALGRRETELIKVEHFDFLPPENVSNLYCWNETNSINIQWKNPINSTKKYDSPFRNVAISYKKAEDTDFSEPVFLENEVTSYTISNIDSNCNFYKIKVHVFDELGNENSLSKVVYTSSNVNFAIGDVILSDGTKIAFNPNNSFTEEQKQKAIAVIFGYTDANIPLGVGFKIGTNLSWTASSSNSVKYYDDYVYKSLITPKNVSNYEMTSGLFEKITSFKIFSEESKSGKIVWKHMETQRQVSTNYPVFDYALKYKPNTNSTETDFDDDWYVPSLVEFKTIYDNKEIISKVFEQITGKALIGNSYYWTSSQWCGSDKSKAWCVCLHEPYDYEQLFGLNKTVQHDVLVIREF